MKKATVKPSIRMIVSSLALLICAALSLWRGSAKLLILDPFGIIDVTIGVLLLVSGYFIIKRTHFETGMFLALIVGAGMTIIFIASNPYQFVIFYEGLIPFLAGVIASGEEQETRKIIWIRRIKGFWEEFSHNKIGLVGLSILLVFIAVAFLEPVLMPYDPEYDIVADSYAMPEWVIYFNPSLRNLPRTTRYSLDWNWSSNALPEGIIITKENSTYIIKYEGNETVTIALTTKYDYSYDPPERFLFNFYYSAQPRSVNKKATVRYSLELNMTKPDGKVLSLWDQHWWRYKAGYCFMENPYYDPLRDPLYERYYPGGPDHNRYGYEHYWHYKEHIWDKKYTLQPGYTLYQKWSSLNGRIPTWDINASANVQYTVTRYPCIRLGFETWQTHQLSCELFSPPGTYTLTMYITFEPQTTNAACEIRISKFEVYVPGLLHGILGTDSKGRDCWSRLIAGTKVSIAVGLAAAGISTLLGVLVGVVSGYKGGIVDEALMRLVDILLCLPFLPLLMILVTIFGRNILYIILFIALFGWLGLARVIRSQVLSLREMPFVEAAKAAGASDAYIMIRHLIPNIMPIALADLILSIPGAILLEASLSFIGFGDPRTPTWGREFSIMQTEVATPYDAWWWMFPPGIAITLLCVAFVFIGHAVDEIVNPRLRRRR